MDYCSKSLCKEKRIKIKKKGKRKFKKVKKKKKNYTNHFIYNFCTALSWKQFSELLYVNTESC